MSKLNLLEGNKQIGKSKTHFTDVGLILIKKAMEQLKGGGTKSNSRAYIGGVKLRLKFTAMRGKY